MMAAVALSASKAVIRLGALLSFIVALSSPAFAQTRPTASPPPAPASGRLLEIAGFVHVGTMTLVATLAPNPADWTTTTFTDATATPGWERLQYRAVAMVDDDPDHAGVAVDSLPSKAFALLVPPPGPPSLALTALAAQGTATAAIVRVDVAAPRRTSPVGDFLLSWVKRQGADEPERDATISFLASTTPTYLAIAWWIGGPCLFAFAAQIAYAGGIVSDATLFLVLGVPLAKAVRKGLLHARETAGHLTDDSADWLRDEARVAMAPGEIEGFLDGVDQVRERSERLQARVQRLAQRIQGSAA